MGSHHSARAETTTWLTPPHVIEALGHFDLDPCGHPNSHTVDCGTGERFTFTGLTYDPDVTGIYYTVHGRNGKWSASATLRSGDVVRVQAKGARNGN